MILTNALVRFLVYMACHFIGDFAFQSTWMASMKGAKGSEGREVLSYHCLTYTSVFALGVLHPQLCAHITPQGLALILLTHWPIDRAKARWGWFNKIWIDQLLHMTVIAVNMHLVWM